MRIYGMKSTNNGIDRCDLILQDAQPLIKSIALAKAGLAIWREESCCPAESS
jgi:hypothetical protein